jgi:protoporphyrinogen oxidase
MKEWMQENFSNELCRLFFNPFNEKYTGGLYDQIIQDDHRKTPVNHSQGYNHTFDYPVQGLDHFIDKLAKESTIHYNHQVVAIDLDKRLVVFQNGEKQSYDRLISTIPLNQFLTMANIKGCILPYTSVFVVNIGARRGTQCPEEQWLYIPGKEPFFRVGFYSNVDKHFAPKDRVSIYVESCCKQPLVPNDIVRQLKRWEWIGEVEQLDSNWIEVAYTWLMPNSERENYLEILSNYGVESIGRYGKWKFQGIADSIADGLGVLL